TARGASQAAGVHSVERHAQHLGGQTSPHPPPNGRRHVGNAMTWGDAAALAARGLVRRIGRSVLTVLAVALATALLVGLLTIANTARTRILSQLSKGGPLASIRFTDPPSP